MSYSETFSFSNLYNLLLVVIGAFGLLIVYTTIGGWLALYSTFFVQLFPEVVDKQSKLYLLYLGIIVRGILTALFTAFITTFVVGFFFRNHHFLFGILTGLFGFFSFQIITNPIAQNDSKIYEILSFAEWGLLIACCGVAAHLGHLCKLQINRMVKKQKDSTNSS